MKYLPTDPRCLAGVLIPKRRAPKCSICDAVLWRPISKRYGVPMHNAKGERLGYVPTHRAVFYWQGYSDRKVRCWNGKACAKRAEVSP